MATARCPCGAFRAKDAGVCSRCGSDLRRLWPPSEPVKVEIKAPVAEERPRPIHIEPRPLPWWRLWARRRRG